MSARLIPPNLGKSESVASTGTYGVPRQPSTLPGPSPYVRTPSDRALPQAEHRSRSASSGVTVKLRGRGRIGGNSVRLEDNDLLFGIVDAKSTVATWKGVVGLRPLVGRASQSPEQAGRRVFFKNPACAGLSGLGVMVARRLCRLLDRVSSKNGGAFETPRNLLP